MSFHDTIERHAGAGAALALGDASAVAAEAADGADGADAGAHERTRTSEAENQRMRRGE
jgi:hypothetical protein